MSTHFQSCNVNSMDPDGPPFADLNTARNMIYLFIYYWKYIIKRGGVG